ncbi:hypothetical protein FLT15_10565 [Paenibacillus thiaminolyticus]|uniref:hypothetical protein n=1 Tax=Paenibacillus thiaminolyticus TaxID=49283 RepID=UPI0013F655BB|nr:hypothetical protein [Paenibacillus thiaminolyticus]NGP58794.1 hypothetical protein [Paenibacillus thiaminolyticus]
MNKEKQYINKQALLQYIDYRQFSGDGSFELNSLQMDIEAGLLDSADHQKDLKQMREEIERLKGKNKHLQEWREAKERIDDVSHVWWHEETAKIKHLFPLENSPGIGQIVEMLLLKETQLQDALTALNWYVDCNWEEYEGDSGVTAAEAITRIQEGNGFSVGQGGIGDE